MEAGIASHIWNSEEVAGIGRHSFFIQNRAISLFSKSSICFIGFDMSLLTAALVVYS